MKELSSSSGDWRPHTRILLSIHEYQRSTVENNFELLYWPRSICPVRIRRTSYVMLLFVFVRRAVVRTSCWRIHSPEIIMRHHLILGTMLSFGQVQGILVLGMKLGGLDDCVVNWLLPPRSSITAKLLFRPRFSPQELMPQPSDRLPPDLSRWCVYVYATVEAVVAAATMQATSHTNHYHSAVVAPPSLHHMLSAIMPRLMMCCRPSHWRVPSRLPLFPRHLIN